MYLASLIIYSIIMSYTTFCALYIVASNFKNHSGTDNTDPQFSISLGDNVFTNLIVSTCSTVGLYFFMSFLYADPWHMFTSSAQYFALLPSYICTLQVYAFCNTHDVSWGTKGDNTIHTDLGAAAAGTSGKGNTVELEMPSEQLDIDSGYDESLRNLRDRMPVPSDPPNEGQMQEDYYRAVRTYMVVVWMVANAVLAMAVSEAYNVTDANKAIGGNFYLKFILWAVAAVALFRALGATTYIILNAFQAVMEGRIQQWLGRLRIPGMGKGRGSTLGEKLSSKGSVWSGGGRSWGGGSTWSRGSSWFSRGSAKSGAGSRSGMGSSLGRSEGVASSVR